MDYLLLILNCEQYRNKALLQKNTWLKNIPPNMNYYHIIGNKEKCNKQDISVDEKEHIIYCNTLDDYNSLPSKIITTLKGVNTHFQYKYIFKTDDDQMLIKENFFNVFINVLEHKLPRVHYGGYIVTIHKDHYSQYCKVHNCLPEVLLLEATTYANGRFYFLSKQAVGGLILKKDKIEKKYIEDHAIGYYLDPIYKENILNMNSNHIFSDI